VTAKWVAPAQAAGAEPRAAGRAMHDDRFGGVVRTRRVEAARAGEERRQQDLIRSEQREDDATRGAAGESTAVHGFHV
jgi:hypothetical protein